MNPIELGLLINALKNKDQGFFLVEVDSIDTLNDLMLKIKIAMGRARKKTAIISFSEKDRQDTIITFIQNKIDAVPDASVLFLTNLVPSTATPKKIAQFFQLLNQTREFLYIKGKCYLFIAYPDVARAFPVFAKELYSWIPQRYRFHAKALSPREFSQALRMEEKTRFVGDKDREYLRDLISVYDDQLRSAPDDESFKINNIITPLADLYKENDQFAKELQMRAEILEYWKQRKDPQQCANAQNNLGNAYSHLPTGDRAENLKKAIAAYHEALTVYTRDAFPADYAMTQNNLGNAYSHLPTGDRAENLKKAIAAYHEALTVYTRDAFPVQYAMTQNNLGTAYRNFPTGDRAENLKKAIAAYHEALTIYTRDAFPVQYATTQNNLSDVTLALKSIKPNDRLSDN